MDYYGYFSFNWFSNIEVEISYEIFELFNISYERQASSMLMSMDNIAILKALKERFDLDTKNSKILVVGLGHTGVSVAYYLQKLGFKFAITDSRDKPPLKDRFFEAMPDTPIFTGGFDESAFEVATHLVVSPGVSLMEKSIVKAIAIGVKVVSDIDLFACSVDVPIVAITGSNGKSTVTTMVGEMASASGKRVAVGGNLGTPALDLLAEDTQLFVLELSSFQLERTSALNAAAATVLNVSADHLDRHDDLDSYAKEKQRIFRGNGVLVLNADDPIVNKMQEKERCVFTFTIKDNNADFYIEIQGDKEYLMHDKEILMSLEDLPLEGRHNAANALAAIALGSAVGLDKSSMCKALKAFKGLDHRMQKIAKIRGVTWVNDSKATNIGACVAALEGYDTKVILIAGGDAKGADMNELAPYIKDKAKGVVLLGKDADLIKQAINESVPTYSAKNMEEAVKICASIAEGGDSVLLSPACASLDQYKNYQDRGNQFSKAVLRLLA